MLIISLSTYKSKYNITKTSNKDKYNQRNQRILTKNILIKINTLLIEISRTILGSLGCFNDVKKLKTKLQIFRPLYNVMIWINIKINLLLYYYSILINNK